PKSGIRYAISFLRDRYVRVQRARVIASLDRIDSLGVSLRRNNTKPRKEYKTRRPNLLWCLDAHLKLIRWGFAMQGIIDAHCRTVSC
ncbi:hypothetical protein BOTBODRAFT_92195, partial [Botryobasidium botryosum FD-172 SS1]